MCVRVHVILSCLPVETFLAEVFIQAVVVRVFRHDWVELRWKVSCWSILCIVASQAFSTSDVKESGFADMYRMAFAQVGDRSGIQFATANVCRWMNFHGFRNFPKLSVVEKESGVASQIRSEVKKWPFTATMAQKENTECESFGLANARDILTNRMKRTLDARSQLCS